MADGNIWHKVTHRPVHEDKLVDTRNSPDPANQSKGRLETTVRRRPPTTFEEMQIPQFYHERRTLASYEQYLASWRRLEKTNKLPEPCPRPGLWIRSQEVEQVEKSEIAESKHAEDTSPARHELAAERRIQEDGNIETSLLLDQKGEAGPCEGHEEITSTALPPSHSPAPNDVAEFGKSTLSLERPLSVEGGQEDRFSSRHVTKSKIGAIRRSVRGSFRSLKRGVLKMVGKEGDDSSAQKGNGSSGSSMS